ncbi:hypothetical protein JTE90_012622 [Oedothorax gibbosus]|uniref:UV excision repair protein RAD23 n=1 Tax=Oedothorax gibbosus TaxID=931172 RepID=A0AAV6UL82_9ARAC|nr:hypothetical protein JTE90_012622 [Oedothorax gibbosus]
MLITLKTLQEDLFTVEIDPEQTVKRLKEKIEEVKGRNYPAKYIKLMYAGKFLLDGNRVCDYNLEEKKFVIAVVKEPKKPDDDDPSNPVPPNEAELAYASENQLSHEEMVERIQEMGFTQREAENALRTCNNNPDRAVDYLMWSVTGSRPLDGEQSSSSNGRMPSVEEANVRFLRHICRPDYSNPNNTILPSEARTLQLYAECADESRQDEGQQEANEDMLESYPGSMESSSRSASASRAVSSCSGNQQSSRYEPLQTVNSYPPEYDEELFLPRDHEAIERLRQLGFPDRRIIPAYFMCDRDENEAADYLFSQYD